jgi:hypothetical protein
MQRRTFLAAIGVAIGLRGQLLAPELPALDTAAVDGALQAIYGEPIMASLIHPTAHLNCVLRMYETAHYWEVDAHDASD